MQTVNNTIKRAMFLVEGEIRSYSGRRMYGRQCLGVYVENGVSPFKYMGEVLANVALHTCNWENADEMLTDFADMLQTTCTDQLGLGTIIYWPTYEPFDL